MRQVLGTLAIVGALLTLYIEAVATFCGLTDGFPVARTIAIFVMIIYIMYHGELNRREFEAKQRKIKALKIEEKKAKWLAEYEEFRREKHGHG